MGLKHQKFNLPYKSRQLGQAEKSQDQQTANSIDCLPCRISGGIVQLGISAFVASHYEQMKSKNARFGLLAFSSGKFFIQKCFALVEKSADIETKGLEPTYCKFDELLKI